MSAIVIDLDAARRAKTLRAMAEERMALAIAHRDVGHEALFRVYRQDALRHLAEARRLERHADAVAAKPRLIARALDGILDLARRHGACS